MTGAIKTAVIGHPVSHSKSPLIHNYWIQKYGLAGSYKAIDIPPENLAVEIRRLADQGYAGFNVTIPHKESIVSLCDEVDETARTIGAVNTVVIKNGKLGGLNTDAFGFAENVKQNAPGFSFSSGPAVVLGAGGAARAVIYALLQEGAPEIILLNRTREKAGALAAGNPKIKILDWEFRADALVGANILINATALGMRGAAPLGLDLAKLLPAALVHDIIYAPLETELVKNARARGNPAVTGIGMLLHQARPAFKAWYGVMPEITPELESMVLA